MNLASPELTSVLQQVTEEITVPSRDDTRLTCRTCTFGNVPHLASIGLSVTVLGFVALVLAVIWYRQMPEMEDDGYLEVI